MAIAAANCINIPLMRQRELKYGIPIYDDQDNRLGTSKVREREREREKEIEKRKREKRKRERARLFLTSCNGYIRSLKAFWSVAAFHFNSHTYTSQPLFTFWRCQE